MFAVSLYGMDLEGLRALEASRQRADELYEIFDAEPMGHAAHFPSGVCSTFAGAISLPAQGEGNIRCPLRPYADCDGFVRSANVPCDRCVVRPPSNESYHHHSNASKIEGRSLADPSKKNGAMFNLEAPIPNFGILSLPDGNTSGYWCPWRGYEGPPKGCKEGWARTAGWPCDECVVRITLLHGYGMRLVVMVSRSLVFLLKLRGSSPTWFTLDTAI